MRKVQSLKSAMSTPSAIGTGLLALDIVTSTRSRRSPRWFAGGTCGNVLAVLAYLGWKAAPISRLAPGYASDRIVEDLAYWKVSTDFVTRFADGSTPVIIHKITSKKSGEPSHSFSWRCPACGAHLPGYKPVLASEAERLAATLRGPSLFVFDRVSRGSLVLAEHVSANGGVVTFEPSGVNDPELFKEAWRLSHIVKYSHERLRDIADVELTHKDHAGVLLEIETLGAKGLRYRSRLPDFESPAWHAAPAFAAPSLHDSAGAGDWCTAGIVSRIARRGVAGLKRTSTVAIAAAVNYGQALAAWNCGFEGARGGMYEVTRQEFDAEIDRIMAGADREIRTERDDDPTLNKLAAQFCPSCAELSVTTQVKQRPHRA
jgi:fructokinase